MPNACRARARLVLLGLFAGGCGMAMTGDRDLLKNAVEEFNEGIRWGKVDQVAAHLPLDRRQPFAEHYNALEDEVEFMDYDIQRIEWPRGAERAKVRVEITWSMKRRGLVERTVVEEDWRKKGGWIVVGSKRVKGSELPVLEQASPPEPKTNGSSPVDGGA